MIGQFIFTAGPPAGFICLELAWDRDDQIGRVRSPDHVVNLLKDHEVGVRRDDEFMSLPIALGYAVMLAGLSGADLVLSGDRSAWPMAWGDLIEMPALRMVRVRSH
jgi:hypothetical protein